MQNERAKTAEQESVAKSPGTSSVDKGTVIAGLPVDQPASANSSAGEENQTKKDAIEVMAHASTVSEITGYRTGDKIHIAPEDNAQTKESSESAAKTVQGQERQSKHAPSGDESDRTSDSPGMKSDEETDVRTKGDKGSEKSLQAALPVIDNMTDDSGKNTDTDNKVSQPMEI